MPSAVGWVWGCGRGVVTVQAPASSRVRIIPRVVRFPPTACNYALQRPTVGFSWIRVGGYNEEQNGGGGAGLRARDVELAVNQRKAKCHLLYVRTFTSSTQRLTNMR